MPYLSKDDLITHVYPEIIDVITRSDDGVVNKCISAGIAEAKAYLNRFDQLGLFGTDSADPTYRNEYLDTLVKDIICWHLIKLSNPNINIEIFRAAYTDSLKALEKIMRGIIDPGWPLRTDTETSTGQWPGGSPGGEGINNGIDLSGNIAWNSNRKRESHW